MSPCSSNIGSDIIPSMKVLLLIGGFGKRLSKVLADCPKPMAPIGNLPFLEYLVQQLASQGLTNIIFCIGYKGDTIMNYFKDGKKWLVNIDYSMEQRPLGTAGAIKLASSKFNDQNFMVMNGDSMVGLDFQELISFHLMKKALATIAVVKVGDMKRFGRVILKKDGGVQNFLEKDSTGEGYINAGIYILNRKVLNFIPEKKKSSLEKEIFPKLIGKGLYGKYLADTFFIDIGTPESYLKIRKYPEKLWAVIERYRKE